jgi:hypothetical protein
VESGGSTWSNGTSDVSNDGGVRDGGAPAHGGRGKWVAASRGTVATMCGMAAAAHGTLAGSACGL